MYEYVLVVEINEKWNVGISIGRVGCRDESGGRVMDVKFFYTFLFCYLLYSAHSHTRTPLRSTLHFAPLSTSLHSPHIQPDLSGVRVWRR